MCHARAIGVALDYQESHPNTLVVVTADHSHTSQIVSEDAEGSGLPTGYSTRVSGRAPIAWMALGGKPSSLV